ncbi:peptidase [Azospirillum brasilense]|uniref:M36 family metallopeptidase n=1 Tax=Azospirillum argentinense TaxID=2970906 RepID=UPI00190A1A85|nr:M36 family metallopeptidase [Azospirillum argentinense]MBK3798121.1 peptidase [Azospirillum argentinense]
MADEKRSSPSDYNALYDPATRAARNVALPALPAERPEVERLTKAVPGLTIDYDEATRNPVRISPHQPAGRLSSATADSPEATAQQFIRDQKDLWQLDYDDVETIDVLSVSRQGLPTVRMMQRVGDVEVFQSNMTVAVAQDNSVVSVTGQLFSGAAAGLVRSATRRAGGENAGARDLSAEDAIAKAASDLTGHPYEPGDFEPASAAGGQDGGTYRSYVGKPGTRAGTGGAEPAFKRPVRVKKVLFPLGGGHVVPGYYIELWVAGYPAFSYVVEAVDTPDILFRKNLTSGATFKYRVHNTGIPPLFRPEDGPAPGTPHPRGEPDGYQAATIPEKLIELESLLPGRPWLPDGATTTRGNNCFAYADLKRPDGFDSGEAVGTVTAPGTFDTRYDHSKPATDRSNLQASLVGMFFHVNWLHDRWYEAGFDEASGNAQEDNFGLGGLDGDPILAEGNDFSGTDNANMSTPADGASPVMQMFVFAGPSPMPSRTSNHEALITFHEMGHYITNRLVGNASGLMNTQGRAMGEGWGDFFAICMTSQPEDNFTDGVFAVGGWTDLRPDFENNYYYSIRRYPYSADMNKSPLTFKHIGANVVLPVGPPRSPDAGGPNNEFHNAGEIWCCALWEVFVNLVAKHKHEEAERRMLQYVIGGLKLTPINPTFLQARDAMMTAAAALNPEDLGLIWRGFAKRGMGDGAAGPSSVSSQLTGVVESFRVPPSFDAREVAESLDAT